MNSDIAVYLVGTPNSGKSTLFNLLTGRNESTGNWSGVTIEKKVSYFMIDSSKVELTDLPGLSFLALCTYDDGKGEQVTVDEVSHNSNTLIVNVVDSSNLRSSLYLTLQLIEMGKDVVVALNMSDIAFKYHNINKERLSELLGVPVITISGKENIGILDLCAHIKKGSRPLDPEALISNYDHTLVELIHITCDSIHYEDERYNKLWVALKVLEEGVDVLSRLGISARFNQRDLDNIIASRSSTSDLGVSKKRAGSEAASMSVEIASSRYEHVDHILSNALHKNKISNRGSYISQMLDNVLLQKFFGTAAFIAIVYLIFAFSIVLGGVFQDFFQSAAEFIFIDGASHLLGMIHAPDIVISIIAHGIGSGIVSVVSFIPVIAALYFIFSILEDSGYFTRAALLVNKLMNVVGLSGSAFIPLVLGFGCNVPAIIATRSLNSKEQRIIAMMMMPFMSCSARLSVFVLFYIIFFQAYGIYIILLLYFIGVIIGLLTAHLTSKMLKNQPDTSFFMVLPNYQLPSFKNLMSKVSARVKGFVFGAGKLIVVVCLVLNLLDSITWRGTHTRDCLESTGCDSVLISLSKFITPIFKPIGIREENWPATVGIVTGLLAKEVVVGTLNSLYANKAIDTNEEFHFFQRVREMFDAAYQNLYNVFISHTESSILGGSFVTEFVHDNEIESSTINKIGNAFDGEIGAFAYLLFILLYFPCVSVFATIMNEIGWRWACISGLWSTCMAYAVSASFYQVVKLMFSS